MYAINFTMEINLLILVCGEGVSACGYREKEGKGGEVQQSE